MNSIIPDSLKLTLIPLLASLVLYAHNAQAQSTSSYNGPFGAVTCCLEGNEGYTNVSLHGASCTIKFGGISNTVACPNAQGSETACSLESDDSEAVCDELAGDSGCRDATVNDLWGHVGAELMDLARKQATSQGLNPTDAELEAQLRQQLLNMTRCQGNCTYASNLCAHSRNKLEREASGIPQ